jgi:hypothetical protein
MQQIPLIPVSSQECTEAAYRLAGLLQDEDDENESWAEAQRERKETKAVRKQAMAKERAIIRRAHEEANLRDGPWPVLHSVEEGQR